MAHRWIWSTPRGCPGSPPIRRARIPRGGAAGCGSRRGRGATRTLPVSPWPIRRSGTTGAGQVAAGPRSAAVTSTDDAQDTERPGGVSPLTGARDGQGRGCGTGAARAGGCVVAAARQRSRHAPPPPARHPAGSRSAPKRGWPRSASVSTTWAEDQGLQRISPCRTANQPSGAALQARQPAAMRSKSCLVAYP